MQMLCTVKLIFKNDLRLAVVKINTIVYLIDCYLYILQVIKILVAVVVVFLIAWGPRLIIQVMQHMKLEMIYTKSAFWTEVNDNNCLLSVVNDNTCLLAVVNDNTCLLSVVNDNTCLLSVVNDNTCLLLVVNDNTCLLLVVNDNTCLLLVVNDNNCLLLVVNDNTCLLLVVNDNTCLLSVVITWKTMNITLSEQFQSPIATSHREVKWDNTSIHNYSYNSYDT